MAFGNPAADSRYKRAARKRREENRERVFWLADQVHLAVYHERPPAEIEKLLLELFRATQLKEVV